MAAITSSLPALPLPVACFLIVPTGTPWYGMLWCSHQVVSVASKGNAGKDEVIAAMRAKGHPVTDDNEADALALLHWAIDTQEA